MSGVKDFTWEGAPSWLLICDAEAERPPNYHGATLDRGALRPLKGGSNGLRGRWVQGKPSPRLRGTIHDCSASNRAEYSNIDHVGRSRQLLIGQLLCLWLQSAHLVDSSDQTMNVPMASTSACDTRVEMNISWKTYIALSRVGKQLLPCISDISQINSSEARIDCLVTDHLVHDRLLNGAREISNIRATYL